MRLGVPKWKDFLNSRNIDWTYIKTEHKIFLDGLIPPESWNNSD
jgi:hypothetical protein